MAIVQADHATIFGKGVFAAKAILTAAGTTVPDEVEDFVQAFDGESQELQASTDGVWTALTSFKNQAAGTIEATIATPLRKALQVTVAADNPTPNGSVLEAVKELAAQMTAASATFDAPTVSVTATPDGGNTGDGKVIVSAKDVYGRNLVYQFPETIEATVTDVSSVGTATFTLEGEQQVTNPFSVDWPGGSGTKTQLTSAIGNTAGNLIGNPSFATADITNANLPDGWIAKGMLIGTTILLTDVEVQRLAISGSPTDGYYTITYTAADGTKQTTEYLAYNASGSTVQSALRNLVGLGSVTVSTTGTTPNFTHDITFTGVSVPGGTITVDTAQVTGGTFTPSKPTAGSAYAARGARAMQWDPNGSEDQIMHYPVTLSELQQYAFSILLAANPVPTTGVITIDLVDGIDGTVIADEAGTNNSFTVTVSGLDGTPTVYSGVFRTPEALINPQCYLRIRATTTIANDGNVYFDQIRLAPMTELYRGGPFVSIVSGGVDWVIGDYVEIAVANNRAGDLLDWHDRIFNLRENGIWLPNQGSGSLADSTYVV